MELDSDRRAPISISKGRLRITVFAAVVTLLQGPLPSVTPALASLEEEKFKCTDIPSGTSCTCQAEGSAPAPTLKRTLAQHANKLQLLCQQPLRYAPDDLTSSKVCRDNTSELTECTDAPKAPIEVKSLLSGSPPVVQWEGGSNANGTPKSLTIPDGNFPFVDERFIVGCLNDGRDKTECQVTVKIAAKLSTTEAQTVTCAYGAQSNPTHQAVTITPALNSFTLVCGEKGEIVQKTFLQTYCPVSKGNTPATSCTGKYYNILPAYNDGWWSGDKTKSFTLTIPKDKFPEDAVTMMVQCQRSGATPAAKAGPQYAATDASICSVEVVIEGSKQASSATPGRQPTQTRMFALLLGVTGIPPILRHEF
ncbi:SAG-related sequence [Besnoitia besnoiti]|uniref:SAG-related sequence n=1 Tax=Besnoitia besnoiti TaxID=94643 RepID=A0A2A9MM23_BESBE|nr:SAG-related sequence [Besnoitia besnoiti]PFH36813.1 SAG-related sequence [Besnoitia besnoiti]